MLRKTVTYTDYDGNQQTEDVYFNMTKAEIGEMQFGTEGGFAEFLQRIIDEEDQGKILAALKDIILKSYGEKSEDGRRFIKSPEAQLEFSQTALYDEVYIEIGTSASEAAAFIRGVFPADWSAMLPEKDEDLLQLPTNDEPSLAVDPNASPKADVQLNKTWEDYTKRELVAMTDQEFAALVGTDPKNFPPEILPIAFQRKQLSEA